MNKKTGTAVPIDISVDEELLAFATIKLQVAKLFFRLLSVEGMSSKELASKLEWAPSRISKILKGGENLTLETMIKILAVFGRTLECGVAPATSVSGQKESFQSLQKKFSERLPKRGIPEKLREESIITAGTGANDKTMEYSAA